MELYRLLQQQGFGSRKECRQLIDYGLVAVDGETIDDWRAPVEPAAIRQLTVDGEDWPLLTLPLYLLLHKPANFETSHKPIHHPSVYRLLPPQLNNLGISAVGRLDVDTTGLLLFSSDGQFVHALTSPKKQVPKLYRVTTKHPVSAELLQRLRDGVLLHDENETLAADSAEQVADCVLDMAITQGKYHQVKRMVAAAGNRVEQLHRLALGAVTLGELPPGQWRHLTAAELAALGFGPA
ncbi:pseudouridine synthase [Vogesella sp. LIG4]|uniref:pseudouridine synthase n=1 Tax=Vogesella sp. LIG4 TaxID=1192162 RepID=UPI00081FC59F|nr:16S rRNA pseudouridine(516) synthase [Vogesella sp. LIG4]SCK13415.1 16S rRNA pseudouridine516 synthase [Vogesella sp. LIG4]